MPPLNVFEPAAVLKAPPPYGEVGLKGEMPPLSALLPKACELKEFGMWLVCDW